MKDKSSDTGPKRSGGTKRRTKFTAGSVIENMNSAIASKIPLGRQLGAKILA